MRMLLNVVIPHEPFNSLVRKGTAGALLGKILDELRPEAVYFTELDGRRGVTLVVDVESPAQVPRFCEPFFLNFNADCKLRIVMGPDELQRAGLDQLGKKWA
jgi:hypothetical protein